jgi:hypothetical protein
LSLLRRKFLPVRFEIRENVRSDGASKFENLLKVCSELLSPGSTRGAMFLREIPIFLFSESESL